MHGLLGSGRNWRSWAKRLAESAATASGEPWRLLLVDLRCHGSSSRLPGLPTPHNIESSASDVIRFLQAEGIAPASVRAIIGHSFGGKVAIEMLHQLEKEAQSVPPQVWVLDSQPGKISDEQDRSNGVSLVLQTVHDIKLPVPNRQWLIDHLASLKFTPALSAWLASNLVPSPKSDGFHWAFDPRGAASLYLSYKMTDLWHVLESPPAKSTVFLVTGDKSDRWPADNAIRLLRANQIQGQRDAMENRRRAAANAVNDPLAAALEAFATASAARAASAHMPPGMPRMSPSSSFGGLSPFSMDPANASSANRSAPRPMQSNFQLSKEQMQELMEEINRQAQFTPSYHNPPSSHSSGHRHSQSLKKSRNSQEESKTDAGTEDTGKFRHLVLQDAGHWVHVDNPTGLLQMVLPRILSESGVVEAAPAVEAPASVPMI
eukprot:CAMPEP_0175059434 /NCGR_PEP_ID=MMETSP0052_2-20121109/12431_1 /TAXON_ID=51329 ORGANISM="Polytomella parva, Strain SAG 63-3" /NCGR_SAMPLE_ID=MMETSP0052_2 /ASSEMBLY_ACC=CAM_ASM_000194 /LENGTH=432 /DNA_ID=CAMNT_0016324985 /DNA_START=195 /DNA_END=1493 /DNA_ORIENTATION=+